ncbi:MAG: ATP-binding cassette domain-containing protein [Planctomycetaceae bacterium]|nr:ATP-binding cassette domain-containing protein [Planctomycetaceae bacterium]
MANSFPSDGSPGDFCVDLREVYYRVASSGFELRIEQFQIPFREKVALTGPSGTGKTTLLGLISGRITPLEGRIGIAGQSLGEMSQPERERFRLRHIGIVFQEFRLIDYLNVAENIALKSRLPGSSFVQVQEQVEEIAERLRLTHLLRRHPRQLSQGERQRAAIGRAIFGQPELILADEPTGNLDANTAAQSLDFLFQAVESAGSTLLLVTHDTSLLPRFDRHIELHALLKPSDLPVSR